MILKHTVVLPEPKPFQKELLDALLSGEVMDGAFLVHRGFGKSHVLRTAVALTALYLCSTLSYSEILIAGPGEKHLASIHWGLFKEDLESFTNIKICKFKETNNEIFFDLGGRVCRIMFRGCARGEKFNIRGCHPHVVFVDEHDETNFNMISEALTPARVAYKAPVFYLGTPKRLKPGEPPLTEWEKENLLRKKAEKFADLRAAGDKSYMGMVLSIDDTGAENDPDVKRIISNMSPVDYRVEMLLEDDVLDGDSYYGSEMLKMQKEGRMEDVNYRSELPVYAAMDIGVADRGVILFFQFFNSRTNIVDMIHAKNTPMRHLFVEMKRRFPLMGAVFVPVDAKKKEQWDGEYRFLRKAREFVSQSYGCRFERLTKTPNKIVEIVDTRDQMRGVAINPRTCHVLIERLKIYGPKDTSMTPRPCDYSDAFRYALRAADRVRNDFTTIVADYNELRARYLYQQAGLKIPVRERSRERTTYSFEEEDF